MHRFFHLIFRFFLIALIFWGCKSQKIAVKAEQTSLAPTIVPPSFPDSITAPQVAVENTDSTVVRTDTLPAHHDNFIIRKDTVVITAVGDIMLGTNFPEKKYLPPAQGREMLAGVSAIFENSDIVFGNLEGVILDSGGTQKECRDPKVCYLFRSPEYMGSRLKEAGFNLFSVANNHAGDFGLEGRRNTAKVLDSLEINFAGNEFQPSALFEIDHIKYGFAAFAPNKGTPNINDLKNARATVAHLDSLVDIVIVSFHGGAEGRDYTKLPMEHEIFYGEDRGDVYKFAHTVIDAGADIVIGHGPHVPRAVEVYKNRFIAYSLGNFATYGRFNLQGVNGLAPIIRITLKNSGEFISGQIISARQAGWGIPEIDPTNTVAQLIKDLTKKDLPEVNISIDESGFISYLHQ